MSEWKGVWPVLPTPLTKDEEADEEGLRNVINYAIEGGVHGLWMLGSRGEGPNLRPRVHKRVLEVTMEEVRGRVPVITGCAAPGTLRMDAAKASRLDQAPIQCMAETRTASWPPRHRSPRFRIATPRTEFP